MIATHFAKIAAMEVEATSEAVAIHNSKVASICINYIFFVVMKTKVFIDNDIVHVDLYQVCYVIIFTPDHVIG